MPLYYNLSKVYELSDNDQEFALHIMALFLEEVPVEIKNIKEGIEEKDFTKVYAASHKIKPTLDLLGLFQAYEFNIQIMDWSKSTGQKKEIREIYKELKSLIDHAVKEIKKDFNL
ncbi:MAG: Hpt domain-containing protein [Flavobacterium sp.]|nr:Hpt domain-containing protein [Candidatus Neoflavobacterium equi]